LNTDGTLDGTFESNSGTGFDYFVYALAIQSNGKIIVGGAFTTYDSVAAEYIARLNTDGTIDTSFDSDPGFDTVVRALSIQSSGQIIVGGDFGTYDGNISDQIARLNSDGTFDKDFSNIEADEEVNIVKIQPADDFILLGGGFSTYDGNSSYYIVRLDTLGKYDTTFVTGDGFNGVVNSIDLDPSNNIYLGGNFTQYDGITQSRIVKLGTNGAIDGTFESNSGTGFDREVYSVVYTPSTGLIYVGGNFTEYNGSSSNKIISLNTDGTIYTSLNVGTGCNGDVRAIAVPGDANVIIGGDFTDYDGNSYNRIVKLQYSTGAVDTSFVVGSGFDGVVKTIEVQQDDKILVGGDFTSYNGRKCNGIVRLESTGEVDLTFNSGFGFDGSVNSIKIQSDDQILVGGDFTSYNNVPKSHFVRLNIDGSIDKTYGVISGFKGGKSSTVKSIDVQFSNDNCVVGGSFNFFNDNEDVFSNVVRLNAHGGTVQTTTSGSGTGFSPNLSIKGGVVTVNYILNYGYGYLPTDTITVGGGDLGGTPGTDDVVLTVDSSIVYTASDKVIWGGKVWENINGNLGSATASDIFTLDQTEWTGVAFNDTDYNVSNSSISYDIDNDKIISRKDKSGNEVTTTFDNIQQFFQTITGSKPYNVLPSITTGAAPVSVFVKESYAYVISDKLQIFDISNLQSITLTGQVTLVSGGEYGLFVQGDYAYITSQAAGSLDVYDVSDPTTPTYVSQLTGLSTPYEVFVKGDYAYIANYGGSSIAIVNVSDVNSLTLESTTAVGTQPTSVFVDGNYAYVTVSASDTLEILDVTTPSSPIPVGTVTTDTTPFSVAVRGKYAYVTTTGSDILNVIDVTDVTAPVVVSKIGIGANSLKIYVQGNFAYVINEGDNVLQIIDISNPLKPIIINDIATENNPYNVFVSGYIAYVVNNGDDSLQVIDLSNNIYNPIKSFQWGNYNAPNELGVGENKVINSLFDCINFRGKTLTSNNLTQMSLVHSNNFESGSMLSSNTLREGSNVSYNELSENSIINSNNLSQTSSIKSNIINNGGINLNDLKQNSNILVNIVNNESNIVENELDNGSIKSNLLKDNSNIDSNTLSKESSIYSNVVYNNSELSYNSIDKKSDIKNNYLKNRSSIVDNKLSLSTFNFSFMGYLYGRTISQIEAKNSNVTFNINFATDIYLDTSKTIFKNNTGDIRLKYHDDFDSLIVTNITD